MSINNGSKLYTGNFIRELSGQATPIRDSGFVLNAHPTIEYPASTSVTPPSS